VFSSDILDLAIGMILMFLSVSLICSALNEFIESLVRNRARDLERGITELLGGPGAKGLVAQIYNHPIVSGLFPGTYNPASARNLPSYIPSAAFAAALMDVLQPAASASLSGASATAPGKGGGTFALAGGIGSTVQFRQSVSALPESPIRTALLTLIDAAGDDAVTARRNIEAWYDSAMDRVSGWYRRRTQFILVGIGFFTALALNADSIGVARALSTNRAARDLVVARASRMANEAPSSQPGSQPASGGARADLLSSLDSLQKTAGLPIGWRYPPTNDTVHADPNVAREYSMDPQHFPQSLSETVSKLVGFVFTALAVSLGAPFWFDLLNKFMVVRSTIKPQEKSEDAANKD